MIRRVILSLVFAAAGGVVVKMLPDLTRYMRMRSLQGMGRYLVVPDASRVRIVARSTLHPIESESSGIEGFVDLEADGAGRVALDVVPKGRIEMALNQLSSGNIFYDREMLRRVDSRRYPLIVGELSAVSRALGDSRYEVTGDITFRGVTCSYSAPMAISWAPDGALTLEGEHTFDVRHFSLEPPRILMFKVHPEVTVGVRITARQET